MMPRFDHSRGDIPSTYSIVSMVMVCPLYSYCMVNLRSLVV